MSTSLAATSSGASSPRCVPFPFRSGGARRGRLPPPAPAAAAAGGGCGRPLCRAAEVLGGGIQSAFFASLDGCSCVDVRTKSFKDPAEESAPLMPPPPPSYDRAASSDGDGGAAGTVRGGGRRKRASAAAGKPRRGLGCCTANSATSAN